ncbi:MAG: T9SS type A sorting domain-containing protein [Syntrophothermus sp.]
MKKFLLIFILCACKAFTQSFTVTVAETSVTHTVPYEFVFDITYKNISNDTLAFYFVRTTNNLPSSWYSSFCFNFCFPPEMDSIATTSGFLSTPLAPNEERVCQLHIVADSIVGTGNVITRIGIFNSSEIKTLSIVANGGVTGVNENIAVDNFTLNQNYPNPFNPSTTISFNLNESSNTTLEVLDIKGSTISILHKGYLPKGNYNFNFDKAGLSSGVYFYRLTSSGMSIIKKMILEK